MWQIGRKETLRGEEEGWKERKKVRCGKENQEQQHPRALGDLDEEDEDAKRKHNLRVDRIERLEKQRQDQAKYWAKYQAKKQQQQQRIKKEREEQGENDDSENDVVDDVEDVAKKM